MIDPAPALAPDTDINITNTTITGTFNIDNSPHDDAVDVDTDHMIIMTSAFQDNHSSMSPIQHDLAQTTIPPTLFPTSKNWVHPTSDATNTNKRSRWKPDPSVYYP
jgi:hypothetical protein